MVLPRMYFGYSSERRLTSSSVPAFAAIGLVAGSFVAIRQRRDTLLTFFALFAILCGLRLWIQSDIVVLALGKSFLLEQLRTDIEFLIPVPMFLFFVAAGYVGRAGRIAG